MCFKKITDWIFNNNKHFQQQRGFGKTTKNYADYDVNRQKTKERILQLVSEIPALAECEAIFRVASGIHIGIVFVLSVLDIVVVQRFKRIFIMWIYENGLGVLVRLFHAVVLSTIAQICEARSLRADIALIVVVAVLKWEVSSIKIRSCVYTINTYTECERNLYTND